MHITNVLNLIPGDRFARHVGGAMRTVTGPVRTDQYGHAYVPVGRTWDGSRDRVFSGPEDMAVVIDAPVRVRPLRHTVAPAYDVLDVGTTMASWDAHLRSVCTGHSFGVDVHRADALYRGNGATVTVCEGDQDWRV